MQIQSINNSKYNNTSFGLKLSKNVAIDIINEYKKYEAKDSEIAYYLRTIQKSIPDTYTLVNNDTATAIECLPEGFNRFITTNLRILKDDGAYADAKLKASYPYSLPDVPDFLQQHNYKAEDKVFYVEHLLKTIKSAFERLKFGEHDGFIKCTHMENNNLGEYEYLAQMAKNWPRIPFD